MINIILITMSDPGEFYIGRNCTNYVIEASSCANVTSSGVTVNVCVCNKDLCNKDLLNKDLLNKDLLNKDLLNKDLRNKSSKFVSFTGLLMFLPTACLAFLLKLQ